MQMMAIRHLDERLALFCVLGSASVLGSSDPYWLDCHLRLLDGRSAALLKYRHTFSRLTFLPLFPNIRPQAAGLFTLNGLQVVGVRAETLGYVLRKDAAWKVKRFGG